MIKVKTVRIKRIEGRIENLFDKTFTSMNSANDFLKSHSHDYPKGGGYDKHTFTVIWEDGKEYQGRLDCKHYTELNNVLNIGDHIKEMLEWYTGRCKDPYCGKLNYEDLCSDVSQNLKDMSEKLLREYEL